MGAIGAGGSLVAERCHAPLERRRATGAGMDELRLDRLHPALALALACCRYPQDGAAQAAVRAAAARIADWDVFERTVSGHRINGLVANALATTPEAVPPAVRERIAASARKATLLDLRLVAVMQQLQASFGAAAVPALFVKGPALAMLAYRRMGLKQSRDIDLLVPPDAVPTARRLLEAAGFALTHPMGVSDATLQRYARFSHEAQFRNDDGVVVELHWRLFDHTHVLPSVTAHSPAQTVMLGGAPVRTLADDLLLPYLAAHGQTSGWSRVKWLADFNALVMQRDAVEIERIVARTEALGVGDAMLAALALCEAYLGLRLAPALSDRIRRDRHVARLTRTNLRCMAHRIDGRMLEMLSHAAFSLNVSRFTARGAWRHWPAELGALWTQPAIRARFPRWLDPFYHLLRIPLFFARLPAKLAERLR